MLQVSYRKQYFFLLFLFFFFFFFSYIKLIVPKIMYTINEVLSKIKMIMFYHHIETFVHFLRKK